MNGQLMPKEREFLHQAVIDSKPKLVFEVGTWKGGGSTWQIVKALGKNGFGKLITCETDREFYKEAMELYKNNTAIEIHYSNSESVISLIIQKSQVPDFIFFDGPEDIGTAYQDFMNLNPILKKGAMFCMHDWDRPSIKAERIRPYIESLDQWKLISSLTNPDSVGICLWEKIS